MKKLNITDIVRICKNLDLDIKELTFAPRINHLRHGHELVQNGYPVGKYLSFSIETENWDRCGKTLTLAQANRINDVIKATKGATHRSYTYLAPGKLFRGSYSFMIEVSTTLSDVDSAWTICHICNKSNENGDHDGMDHRFKTRGEVFLKTAEAKLIANTVPFLGSAFANIRDIKSIATVNHLIGKLENQRTLLAAELEVKKS